MYSLDPDRLHVSRMHLVQWLSGTATVTDLCHWRWLVRVDSGRPRFKTRCVCFLPSLLTFVIEIEANHRLLDGLSLEL